MPRSHAILATFVTLLIVSGASAQETPERFVDDAKQFATQKRWVEAFAKIDEATERARLRFNQLLQSITEAGVDQSALAAEHNIVEHFATNFFPIFEAGYALAIQAQKEGAFKKEDIARRAAFWALNGKGMARQVIAERLRQKRAKKKPEEVEIPKPISVEQIQQHLPEGTVLVEMIQFKNHFEQDQHWYAAIIIPGGKGDLRLVDLQASDPINTVVRNLQTQLEAFDPSNPRSFSQSTDDLKQIQTRFMSLIDDEYLKKENSRWILSPTADLWLVPFHAVQVQGDLYAIESHVISYEIAGRDVLLSNQKKPQQPAHIPALIIGIPNFDLPADAPVSMTNKRDSQISISPLRMRQEAGYDNRNYRKSIDVGIRSTEKNLAQPPSFNLPVLTSTKKQDSPDSYFTLCGLFRSRRACFPFPLIEYPSGCHQPIMDHDNSIPVPLPEPIPHPVPPPRTPKADLLGGELESRYENSSLRNIAGLPEVIAQALKGQFPKHDPLLLLNDQAREDTFEKTFSNPEKKYKTVILITHGFFLEPSKANSNPEFRDLLDAHLDPLMRCGMILAGYNTWPRRNNVTEPVSKSESKDGVLTGHEVVEQCNLEGTELVALIGCGSGVGQKYFGGDSLASLRYAFSKAGAEVILGTSWSVRVEPSAKLMNVFFEKRVTSKLSADGTLQEVQKEYIKLQRQAKSREIHPYYWAAFSITR